MEDLLALLFVALCASGWLLFHLFVGQQQGSAALHWERRQLQQRMADEQARTFNQLDEQLLVADGRGTAGAMDGHGVGASDSPSFVLSRFSLPVHRSLWRIVEYVLSDFIDFWWVKISDSPDLGNDLRAVFDHAFNVLGERSLKIDWTRFIVTNVISNVNYLMRIYRLTEQELNSHNPFFAQTPEEARHRLIKAELLRNYKLHVAVSNPQAYLRKLSTAVLSRILKQSDFKSEVVRTLTREVFTTFIFLPVMNFVDPYWLNVGIVTALKKMATAPAAPEEREEGSTVSKKITKHVASLSNGGYAPITLSDSKGSSRSNSPSRSAQMPPVPSAPSPSPSPTPSPDIDSVDTLDAARGNVANASGSNSTTPVSGASSLARSATMCASSALSLEDIDAPPVGGVPHRKESVLTHKMQQWEGEKAKRQEKSRTKASRKSGGDRTPGSKDTTALSSSVGRSTSSRFHPSATFAHMPHDDSIPTGLASPQGAFSHSPNHALSPMASPSSYPIPSPSQLSGHWEVRIVAANIRFDPKPYVMYELRVQNGPHLRWSVLKRYARFEELHQKLKKAIPSFDAQLPKKHFFGNLDQAFIQQRKAELQTYLGQLLWNRTVQENPDLQQFLLPHPEEAKQAQLGTAGFMSGTSTPSLGSSLSLSNLFKGRDAQKEKESAAAAATANQLMQQQQRDGHQQRLEHAADAASPHPSSFAPGRALPPPMAVQNTMPVMSGSVLHAAIAEDETDIFAPSSVAPSNKLDSPARSSRMMPSASFSPFHSPQVSAHPILSVPPSLPISSSPSPPATPQTNAALPVRTYSSDDILPMPIPMPAPVTQTQQQASSSRSTFSLGASGIAAVPGTSAPSSSVGVPPSSLPSTSTVFSWEDKSLTDPLYLLVEEMFNLNGRGWMRRQATWVGKQLVRMTMDDLVKAQLNRQVDAMLNENALTAQIDWITELIWPNGKLFESSPPITQQERDRVKAEALRLLKASIPTGLRTLLGREHCLMAMEKCFEFLQMEPLIQHFAYSVLDSLVLEMFPDLTHVLGR